MKQTKQVKKMVEAINQRMKDYHINKEDDPVFATMAWLLSKADCYHGFNYFTEDGRLAGSENCDHLELYIR